MSKNLEQTLASLPPEWPEDLLPRIQAEHARNPRSIVVLDDDPTGCQTVHDVPIVTEWSLESIKNEFRRETPLFYILTNSRTLQPRAAEALAKKIGKRLKQASASTGRRFVVITRSDSTLRGHYPVEVVALANALNENDAIQVLVPFFLEGGRYTLDDVHYVAEGDQLIPAGETAFARDASFSYHASDLKEWVAEKTNGAISVDSVTSLTLTEVRQGGPAGVAEKLSQILPGGVCVVNAASMRDLEVVTLGLLTAEKQNQRFIFRTAASFVRAFAGLAPKPLLTAADLNLPASGGALFVVGSYVPRSTTQLNHLLEHTSIKRIEINVERLLSARGRAGEIKRVVLEAEAALKRNLDIVLYTSRELITGGNAADSLDIVSRVSQGIVQIVKRIRSRPRYVLAKGGITASDIATKSFGLKRAIVPGQILPGVPVYRFGLKSKFPGLTYVVFPGNVGGPDALTSLLTSLKAE